MAAQRRKVGRQREAQIGFEALSIEGGILSPEWLSRVAKLGAGQQAETDYRVPKGLALRDEIGRYWRVAQAYWGEFAAGRAGRGDPTALVERFVPALLREAFGFASLAAVEPASLAERSYPIGRAALGGRVPVVLTAPKPDSPDDRRSALDEPRPEHGDAARRRSAFGLAQEYLNADTATLWGVASDGVTLRILRNNASLTRPAWIEADLARLFTEERYADFAALWLLLHESRFGREGQPTTDCALEAWRSAGREEGTRAREHLRRGVEEALEALGHGFLAHPENTALRSALQTGTLRTQDYFNQLLRLVYRLIFLLTVEERVLLHADGTPDAVKGLYAQGYSVRGLRERAVKRSAHDRSSDLWEAAKVVFRGVAVGEPRLGLPALAGIFGRGRCASLDGARLENRALLLAVFKLAWLREGGSLARVNWRDMGPEELGSVYESLLELVPQIAEDGRRFAFATGGGTRGNARKTTGSYYTPDSLVQVLLDSALEPVIADTLARNPVAPVEALLGLSIVDPACGSGHFLLAAARRVAAHVARLQASGTPSAAEYRHAVRQVVGRCLYGVDLNPMAIELCKVSLWMEAVEPGLPLTFLDAHIQHGNALLGTTPDLMAKGIPDAAWEPIEGDDKKVASALKKQNKAERAGFTLDLAAPPASTYARLGEGARAVDAEDDTSLAAIDAKAQHWEDLVASLAYAHQRLLADLWCAAFVWRKEPGALRELAPTEGTFRAVQHDGAKATRELREEVARLATGYRFFHWHLGFPQVFAKGGFDVVLGNPPWERVKIQEEEFFGSKNGEIANALNASARKALIAQLPQADPKLWTEWCAASREAEGESLLIRQSRRYPLCGKGDVNTYAIFAEHNRALLGARGCAGFIVPTGIATDDTTKEFFADLMVRRHLGAFYGFENEAKLFRGIDHRVNFCLMVLSRSEIAAPNFSAFIRDPSVLRETGRVYQLTAADIKLLNPNTSTCPVFRSRRDAELNLSIYRRTGVLWKEEEVGGNVWGLRFLAMFHMANDSGLFRTRANLEAAGWKLAGNHYVVGEQRMLPLIEGKMVYLLNHRFGDFALLEPGEREHILPQTPEESLAQADYLTLPRYWVPEDEVSSRLRDVWSRGWLLGWRDVTDARSSVRTLVASLIPRVAVGHKVPLMFSQQDPRLLAALYANLCSLVLDYAARQKVGGTSMTYFLLKQFPVLKPHEYSAPPPWGGGSTTGEWLLPRVLELTYTAWDLEPFASDVGYGGPPFRWNPERRFLLRCELDAAFFHLYGLSRDDVDYVMDTFPIVRKNDEKADGKYRTKLVILDVYDAMAEAARSGRPYQTRLDPLPADPRIAHAPRVPALPAMPSVVPQLPLDQEAAILIWALLHAGGGALTRMDLARAFTLRAQPDLLTRLAPASLTQARDWATRVGARTATPGLLAASLKALSDRGGVTLSSNADAQSIVGTSSTTPAADRIDPWFHFEAGLALQVLRAQPARMVEGIDGLLADDDRALLEGVS